VVCEVIVGK